ncbi:D-alanyl-D-alanine carboxypeptidase family protein [Marinicrinis sediminis]|uniref:serine-type D-Ala-D-Ala carboxypeptidase n=1 Tax=Marinicrinis sediminis TaxID=1652465 RepID=A0ABW5RAM7_9BACL
MKKKWNKWMGIVCTALMLSLFVGGMAAPQSALAEESESLNLQVKSAILIEANTGQVLYEMNADEARPPASMAKMMTEYVVMKAIEDGQISYEDSVTISRYAATVIGSGQLLDEGRQYKVKDLLRNMIIFSGNDAAVALAEYVGGNETNFVNMMNETAKEIGLSDTAYFANATGLDNEEDLKENAPDVPGETVISARDTAKLAQKLIHDFPEALEFSKIPRATLHEDDPNSKVLDNWNWMLEGWKEYNNNFSQLYAYEGLDGLKTGHTDEAGFCFTGTAERDGMRLISVVMHADTIEDRFNQTSKLMDYGYNNFEMNTVLSAKSELADLKTVEVKKAKDTDLPVVTGEGVTLVTRKGEAEENIQITASPTSEELVAPIKQGDKVGEVTVTYAGPVGEVVEKVDLVAAEDAEKAGWFKLLMRAIANFFASLFEGIKNLF